MSNELIRLIDPESARAVEETAKTTGKAIDAVADAGKCAADVLGDLPRNVVGLAGDYIRHKRIRNEAKLSDETERILRERNVKDRNEPSPSLLIPLLAAALDEDRDELRELWAKLLAALLDPDRAGFFRSAFIDAAKKMDPLDARVLESAHRRASVIDGNARNQIAGEFSVIRDQVDISVDNLVRLDLMGRLTSDAAGVSHFGREFLRAVK
jgi:Abortive infection alpha